MSSTSLTLFVLDVEPLLVMAARYPELAESAKTAIGDRIGAIPKLSAAQAAGVVVRHVWPGIRSA